MLFLVLVLAVALAGCDAQSSRSLLPLTPSSVSPSNPIPPTTTRVFTERSSGFSTSDLRDAHDQIVQFNIAGDLIWTPDDTRLPGYFVAPWSANFVLAPSLCQYCGFQVRFGSQDGEKRAYLTIDYGEDNSGHLADLEVIGGALVVTRFDRFPPGTYTVSGVITEETATGREPILHVHVRETVYDTYTATNEDGFYRLSGLSAGTNSIVLARNSRQVLTQAVVIAGDTRLDIQLPR